MQTSTNQCRRLTSLFWIVTCKSARWLPGVFTLILLLPGLVLAQGTNISFPGFRSSFISGTHVTIIATANAVVGTTISKVEFLVSSATTAPATTTIVLGEDVTSPYAFTWTIPAGQPSYNELRTRVTYTNGVTAVSSSVPVDVYEPTISSNVNYYVAPAPLGTTAPANNGTSPTAPWSTIQAAMQLAKPGDVINVMAGTYTVNNNNVVSFRRTGTPTHWVTLKNYQNDRPIITANGPNAIVVTPNVAYARIQGLELIGSNQNEPLGVTLPKAYAQAGSCTGPTSTPPNIYNTNGISIDGRNAGIQHPHHIEVTNNTVHDFAGAGIGAIQADYITIENNTSYNNSWFTVYGTSGINMFNTWNFDGHPGTTPTMIIRNNKSYNNRLYVRWKNGTANTCRTYDGNGIILDNNNGVTGKNPLGAYTGRFLIENNLTYQNGGRGININYTDNVTILNNTSYQNGATNTVNSPATGEVTDDIQSELIALGSNALNIYNNIFYGRAGERTIDINAGNTNVSHNNNLTFGGTGTSYFTGNQNIIGQDPTFVDASTGNFQLQPGSPAINKGSNIAGQFAPKDILGIDRPQGTGVDIGAYEFQGTPVIISQQPASSSAVCVGTDVSVSVVVDGPADSYQWYKDGAPLTGVASATTATLLLPNVSTTDMGSYSVVITGFNSVTSSAFSLTVNAEPTLSLMNDGPLTCAKTVVTLTASTTSSGSFVFRSAAGAISGTGNAASVSQPGTYTVSLTDVNGCTATAGTTVDQDNTPPAAPTLVTDSGGLYPAGKQAVTVAQYSGLVTLTASACSSGTLRWSEPATAPDGQTSVGVPTTATGSFVYQVSCQLGTCTSAPASVTVTVMADPLRVVVPLYNCTTGLLTLRTTGGNGQPVEFNVGSVTSGWTTNAVADPFSDKKKGPDYDKKFNIQARQLQSDGKGNDNANDYKEYTVPVCGSARLGVEPEAGLQVVVLGNPTSAETVLIRVDGVGQQPLLLRVINARGQVVSLRAFPTVEPGAVMPVQLGQHAGVYLLEVSTDSQRRVVRIAKQ